MPCSDVRQARRHIYSKLNALRNDVEQEAWVPHLGPTSYVCGGGKRALAGGIWSEKGHVPPNPFEFFLPLSDIWS